MLNTEYCTYPPQIAEMVEVREQNDNAGRVSYIIGSAMVGRYILLRSIEYDVLRLIDTNLTLTRICDEFKRKYEKTLSLATLSKFLSKLDEVGILAGERTIGLNTTQQAGMEHYLRFNLFNPDRVF